jgi:hypothetical protein
MLAKQAWEAAEPLGGLLHVEVVGRQGFEPWTPGLKVRSSTAELTALEGQDDSILATMDFQWTQNAECLMVPLIGVRILIMASSVQRLFPLRCLVVLAPSVANRCFRCDCPQEQNNYLVILGLEPEYHQILL